MTQQSVLKNKNPRNAERLTPDAIAKMSPKEKEDRQHSSRATRLQQLEVPVCEALLASQKDGWPLEGEAKVILPIADIAVHVIGADDQWVLPKSVREELLKKGGIGSSIFMLRAREKLADELDKFMLAPDAEVELPGRNRKEKRMARQAMDRYPFRVLANKLRERLPDGCYYAVVHSMAGASIFPFRYDASEIEAGLAEEYEKNKG